MEFDNFNCFMVENFFIYGLKNNFIIFLERVNLLMIDIWKEFLVMVEVVLNKESIILIIVLFASKFIQVLVLVIFPFLIIVQYIFIIDFVLPYFEKSLNISFHFLFFITTTHSTVINIHFVN